jgi:predicted metal-dependent enzyme (double-stranded beta helix superfamily)
VTALDDPIRTLLERIAAPAAASTPDLAAIGAALAELAADRDYLAHRVARLDGRPGAVLLHGPAIGPRLQLVHRPTGGFSAVHDHGTWVALAAIAGLETHRHYRLVSRPEDGRPWPVLEEEVALAASEVATLLPPDDIHDHGHLMGRGEAAHILVLTGDDQRRFTRTEWDLATGRQRALPPGEGGRWLATDPWSSA